MIRYTLKCGDGHRFDSWFQSASAFDTLAKKGLVGCAVCGGTDVTKAMMAPRVASEDGAASSSPESAEADRPLTGGAPHPAEQMLRAMRAHLEAHSTDVGRRFAQEARAMHLGETAEKPIHGQASADEARALIDDGVPIAPLPIRPTGKTN